MCVCVGACQRERTCLNPAKQARGEERVCVYVWGGGAFVCIFVYVSVWVRERAGARVGVDVCVRACACACLTHMSDTDGKEYRTGLVTIRIIDLLKKNLLYIVILNIPS